MPVSEDLATAADLRRTVFGGWRGLRRAPSTGQYPSPRHPVTGTPAQRSALAAEDWDRAVGGRGLFTRSRLRSCLRRLSAASASSRSAPVAARPRSVAGSTHERPIRSPGTVSHPPPPGSLGGASRPAAHRYRVPPPAARLRRPGAATGNLERSGVAHCRGRQSSRLQAGDLSGLNDIRSARRRTASGGRGELPHGSLSARGRQPSGDQHPVADG